MRILPGAPAADPRPRCYVHSSLGPMALGRVGLALFGFCCRDFVVVEVAICLGGKIELQLIIGRRLFLAERSDLDVMQRHNAWQRRDTADECPEFVIATGELDVD